MKGIWSKAGGLGKRGYQIRFPSGIIAAILIIVHQLENKIALTWVDYALVVIVLTMPHFFLLRYVQSGNDKGLAFRQINYDLFVAGGVAGALDLSVIPATIYTLTALSVYVAARGFNNLYQMLLIPLGIAITVALQGFHFHFQSTPGMIGISLGYAVCYFTFLSFVSYIFAKRQYLSKKLILGQKHEIDEKASEILAQAEELHALNESLKALNENLEKRIDERTNDLKIKNKKLSDYSFINAHKLRAPVATILGLVQLLDYDNMFRREDLEIISRLKNTASDLDGIVHEIKINLEKEGLADDLKKSETKNDAPSEG